MAGAVIFGGLLGYPDEGPHTSFCGTQSFMCEATNFCGLPRFARERRVRLNARYNSSIHTL